eukprot:jgi/Mesen1/10765/ME000091S10311
MLRALVLAAPPPLAPGESNHAACGTADASAATDEVAAGASAGEALVGPLLEMLEDGGGGAASRALSLLLADLLAMDPQAPALDALLLRLGGGGGGAEQGQVQRTAAAAPAPAPAPSAAAVLGVLQELLEVAARGSAASEYDDDDVALTVISRRIVPHLVTCLGGRGSSSQLPQPQPLQMQVSRLLAMLGELPAAAFA